ncbi:ribonuclease H-like domain-containing protein [Natrinema limicola]|uniref:YprB ribonuclease H-like domain-containing protein n=1 Tax=Natrinema limicola JCM 13563 TaxID=1230457 RepID=M0BY82_9EURY|nr:ribonuclease H-like domain-containing protein [Natrinema limicola]ELZ15378.1 hypothetical protein C476_17912 [Natrinema limicola JCM 13563]
MSYQTFHRGGDDEVAMIARTHLAIDNADADALVTYHGKDFDLEFLSKRLSRLGVDNYLSALDVLETLVDLSTIASKGFNVFANYSVTSRDTNAYEELR